MSQLRVLALDRLLGYELGADQLIRAGLEAVLAGLDSPSLNQLAGLTPGEEPEARELFAAVVDELDLAPTLPADPPASYWALVRWRCREIVHGPRRPPTSRR